MSAIIIRGLNEETLVKLTHEAKKRGIPREELLRKILENFSIAPALSEQHERYHSVLITILEVLTHHTDALTRVSNILDYFLKKEGFEV